MKNPIQAVVLAGGLGTRLGSMTRSLPKPMMDVSGRPFLSYLLENLRRQGIQEVILSVGHLADIIRDFADNISRPGFQIKFASENEPLGTGGALRNCMDLLQEDFFVLNGDTLFDVNLASLATSPGENKMALRLVPDAGRYGSASLDGSRVVGFLEKGIQGEGLINGGVLHLSRASLGLLPPGKSSIESDLLPKLAEAGRLHSYRSDSFFIDIGIPESLEEAQASIPDWEKKPIAFLDRDGVLNHDLGHVHKVEQFKWIDGAQMAVRYLNDMGYHVVLVTNQAGIAKGMYSEEDFHALTRWMKQELWKHGAHLDAVYHCPYHPDAIRPQYRKASEDRKPGPGMLLRAMAELPCDLPSSFFIGNQPTDRQAANGAHVRYLDFQGGNLLEFVRLMKFLKS
jgi:D-glycero-D-manno-heptose 1,7-bisphosphate phosphatase